MKLRLLIVEDDRLLAEAVSDYFENKGWDTVTAYDGETALETDAIDLASAAVSGALAALGGITGANATEDVLDGIFSRFCVGK